MDINDVVEIFKSAIIQGDLNDAYNILERNLNIYTRKKWKRRSEMVSMLLKTIKNEIQNSLDIINNMKLHPENALNK